jgi:glycosyltransferase 2 family protein
MLRRRGLELLCLALGVALLAATLWAIGAETLVRDLRTLGWALAAILLVEGASVVFNTLGWAAAFPPGERTVSAGRLLAARLAGDSVNYLTPSASVGGELLRVRLLGAGVAPAVRWASVTAAKVAQSLAQAIIILLGVAVALPDLAPARGWFGRPLAVAVATLAAAAALVPWIAFVRAVDHGFWRMTRALLDRCRLAWILPAAWYEGGRDLDATLARLGRSRAAASLGCFLAGWAVGAVEIYLILRGIGSPVGWRMALALEAGSALLDGILFFVPAKVGTQEGGKVALFAALGLDPARGLTVGVVRRIRELFYATLGLAALGWLSARPHPALASASASADDQRHG